MGNWILDGSGTHSGTLAERIRVPNERWGVRQWLPTVHVVRRTSARTHPYSTAAEPAGCPVKPAVRRTSARTHPYSSAADPAGVPCQTCVKPTAVGCRGYGQLTHVWSVLWCTRQRRVTGRRGSREAPRGTVEEEAEEDKDNRRGWRGREKE